MLKSMTGFGIATLENEIVSITVEVKSINSKSQDFSLRLPRMFQDKETEVKTLLGQAMERGKVNLNVEFVKKGSIKPKLTINSDMFKAYAKDIMKNAQESDVEVTDMLRIITSLPEVFDVDKTDNEIVQHWDSTLKCIEEAIRKCNDFRLMEGGILDGMLRDYIKKIDELLVKASEQDPQRIDKIREKLKTKMSELIPTDKIDGNRFEQELIFYIEKIDITEEKVRLKSHLDYFLETMDSKDANGKKLGFIAQEIGREINTLGSKANDALIQKWVIEMKEELEKIKEQSLNVL